MSNPFADFEKGSRTFRGVTRNVWTGGDGPPVIVMHEIPGLHPEVVDFARKVVMAGFRVVMPSMFGKPGKKPGPLYMANSIARACVSREFTVLATRKNSEITDWLRDLAREEHERSGHNVGAIGMCLTGGFALAMMVDDHMMAPVLSQPSLPFAILPHQCRDLGVDDETLAKVKKRCVEDGVCLMGLRFSMDRMVPSSRFRRLETELGDNFIAVEINSALGNGHRIKPWAHSVLAIDYVDQPGHPTHDAMLQVIDFFREKLADR